METMDKLSNTAQEAFDKIVNVSNQAKDALGNTGQEWKSAEQKLVKNCRSYVRDNPLTSLGIATAAGFLISRLLSRR
ncbi:MAG: DUF883 domain-containing protein [Methylococcales bacterium]